LVLLVLGVEMVMEAEEMEEMEEEIVASEMEE
jgi:hypothetical protein